MGPDQAPEEAVYRIETVLDGEQLTRIEAVHRGFLYQHIFATACILQMPHSETASVLVERDEDVELVLPHSRIYVQVKTRSRPLQWGDIESALARYAALREEHSERRRLGEPSFVVAANVAPGNALRRRLESDSWPSDVALRWPTSNEGTQDDSLPPAWPAISQGIEWCIEAAGRIAFPTLSPETLVWKLAAHVAYASSGARNHQFDVADLPSLFEQLIIQLQDFPAPPSPYRPQEDEPLLITDDHVRLILGLAGAGKTSWAAQAALHNPGPVAYFDLGDLPAPALASSLARELAARFLGAGRARAALLPVETGLPLLRALNLALIAEHLSVTVVLDNIHLVETDTIRSLIDASSSCHFILLGRPWPGQTAISATYKIKVEEFGGWSLDAIATEFTSIGCRLDLDTAARVLQLTAGIPLFVQSAAQITRDGYASNAGDFCLAIEQRLHVTETAQEIILGEVFNRLSGHAQDVAACLALSDVPLTIPESLELTAAAGVQPQVASAAMRELGRTGLTQVTQGNSLKLHDAFRVLATERLQVTPQDTIDRARMTLRDLLARSLPSDLGRLSLWMRLLAQTGRIDMLVDLATDEMFHEIGTPSELKSFLDSAAESTSLPPRDRFWAIDAVAFWEYQDGDNSRLSDHLAHMADLVEQGGLGHKEQVDLSMKQMILFADQRDGTRLEKAYRKALRLAGNDMRLSMIVRYNKAAASFRFGRYRQTERMAAALVTDYYRYLNLAPKDVTAKNPPEIRAMLTQTPTLEDDLKHLADCLYLYATATDRQGKSPGLAWLHAMKFYALAQATRSAVKAGQEAVDQLIELGLLDDARRIMENHILPTMRDLQTTDLLLPVRAQYAVLLAWCGEIDAARAEMTILMQYDSLGQRQAEMQAQRALIEQIAVERDLPGPPPPLTDGTPEL